MKKSRFPIVVIAIAIISIVLLTSCDKKHTTEPDHGSVMVTMTNTPNPATVNTLITFNFSIMEDNVAKDVTDATCEVKQASTSLSPMMIEKNGTGMYMGEYTYTKAGNYTITLNFKHDGEMNMKEFSIEVK